MVRSPARGYAAGAADGAPAGPAPAAGRRAAPRPGRRGRRRRGRRAGPSPLPAGRSSRQARSTGRPSIASKSTGRSRRASSAVRCGDPGEAGVRDRDALADAGRAEPLACQQLLAERGRVQAQLRAGAASQRLEHAPLVGRPQARDHAPGKRGARRCAWPTSLRSSPAGPGTGAVVVERGPGTRLALSPARAAGSRRPARSGCSAAAGIGLDLLAQLPDVDPQVLRRPVSPPQTSRRRNWWVSTLPACATSSAQDVVLLGRQPTSASRTVTIRRTRSTAVAAAEDRPLALLLQPVAERGADAGEQLVHAERLGRRSRRRRGRAPRPCRSRRCGSTAP